MPGTLSIGFFVMGAVLLFIGITGGNFELFGAKVPVSISNIWLRWLTALGGLALILIVWNPIPPSFVMSDPATNTDRSENDFSNYEHVSLDDCASKCLNSSICTAYAYRESEEKCFLKQGEGKPEAQTGITSGVKIKK